MSAKPSESKPSTKPSAKPEVKPIAKPVTQVLTRPDEYVISLVPIETFPFPRVLRPIVVRPTEPHIVISKYEINIKDMELNWIIELIDRIEKEFKNLLTGYYLEQDKLVIYIKSRKNEKIQQRV